MFAHTSGSCMNDQDQISPVAGRPPPPCVPTRDHRDQGGSGCDVETREASALDIEALHVGLGSGARPALIRRNA